MEKKRHHFVAETYLSYFCNDARKLCVYFKDKKGEFQFIIPDAIGFEKYYYSQPLPGGGRNNNAIEDFFEKIETKWQPLVQKIESRKPLGRDDKITLLEFVLLHRVRVPTARDAAEKMLAERVKLELLHLVDTGSIPPPPEILGDIADTVKVAIDPHMSIHAMAHMAQGVAKIFDAIGFELLENKTTETFLTSDNPVIYFDPTIQSAEPYKISRERLDIEFMFPITPHFLLWGHSALRGTANQYNTVPYQDLIDGGFVERANTMIVRFAHRTVFSNSSKHQKLVQSLAARSPTLSATHIKTKRGRGLYFQSHFGTRQPKPRWKESGSK